MRALCAIVLSVLLVSPALAQEWPARPVRLVVPFPPGGAADAVPRIVGERLALRFNQPFLVENRAGATGTIAAELVSRAAPDGYTFLATPPSTLVLNPYLYVKLPYDASRFVPVSVMAAIPSVLLAHPKVGAASVAELVALIRASPGKLNYASQGATSVSFLTTEWFFALAGGAAGSLRVAHVPYKGTGPALASVLAGETELFFDNLGTSLQHVRAGRLKALAVAGERRHASLPEVPAMNELYPGFVSVAWFGIVAPPGTPGAIAERLSSSIQEVLKMPEVRERLGRLSAEPLGLAPAQMARFMKEDAERWRQAIRAAGVKPGEL
ncbi:MAG: Bug family tripartite tricarboxylate transporter substrate binding protein [Burkholderiales bacterium]